MDDTKRNLNRSLELFSRNLISAATGIRPTAYIRLKLLLERPSPGEGQEASWIRRSQAEAAQAQIKQAEAELELAQVNLDHTKITAPVTGNRHPPAM